MLCMKKHFARKPSFIHLTVLDTDVVLNDVVLMLHLHVDFTLTALISVI